MATHGCSIVNCQATHQIRSRTASTVQLAHICSEGFSWRDVDFVYRNAAISNTVNPFLYSRRLS